MSRVVKFKTLEDKTRAIEFLKSHNAYADNMIANNVIMSENAYDMFKLIKESYNVISVLKVTGYYRHIYDEDSSLKEHDLW